MFTKDVADSLLYRQTVLAALPESLPLLHDALMAFGERIVNRVDPSPDPAVLDAIHVAAMEIAANIVEHAYPIADPQSPLQVNLALFPDRIELALYDQGQPFDPALLAAPCLPDPLARHGGGGWGLALASRALDRLSYRRGEDGINEWQLMKQLTPS